MKKILKYFSVVDLIIWTLSLSAIIVSFFIFDGKDYLKLSASIIGASSALFVSKGNPTGQVLSIIFSVLYGIISYKIAYYGEMITYLGMTAPMALVALIAWLKNPFKGNRAEVKINTIKWKEIVFMCVLAAIITFIFYFILKAFNTANIIPSTISVTTSFIAVYMTFRRSPYYAIGYAMNDLILIILWSMASVENITYITIVICSAAFFVNDIYGFICWQRRKKLQEALDWAATVE